MNILDKSNYTANQYLGKFEGEPAETEYFYEQMLNGNGDAIYESNFMEIAQEDDFAEGLSAVLFNINTEEAKAFDLTPGTVFIIREDSQGFVYGSVHADRDKAEAKFRAWLGL